MPEVIRIDPCLDPVVTIMSVSHVNPIGVIGSSHRPNLDPVVTIMPVSHVNPIDIKRCGVFCRSGYTCVTRKLYCGKGIRPIRCSSVSESACAAQTVDEKLVGCVEHLVRAKLQPRPTLSLITCLTQRAFFSPGTTIWSGPSRADSGWPSRRSAKRTTRSVNAGSNSASANARDSRRTPRRPDREPSRGLANCFQPERPPLPGCRLKERPHIVTRPRRVAWPAAFALEFGKVGAGQGQRMRYFADDLNEHGRIGRRGSLWGYTPFWIILGRDVNAEHCQKDGESGDGSEKAAPSRHHAAP